MTISQTTQLTQRDVTLCNAPGITELRVRKWIGSHTGEREGKGREGRDRREQTLFVDHCQLFLSDVARRNHNYLGILGQSSEGADLNVVRPPLGQGTLKRTRQVSLVLTLVPVKAARPPPQSLGRQPEATVFGCCKT